MRKPLLLLTLACLGLTACTPPKPPTADQAGATKVAAAKPAAKPAGKQRKLAAIVFQEDQFFRMVLAGMRQGAKAHNCELLVGVSGGKPEKELELVNTYIAAKVDAILIAPLSKTNSVKALQAARDKGIVVITHNTPVDSDLPAAHIECNPTALGAKCGVAAREYIEKKLDGKAKLAVVHFDTQLPEQSKARIGGFKSELGKLKGVVNVAEQAAWVTDKAVKVVGDMLTAHPDIQVICCANEGATEGATLAVKNAGRAGKVAVFGIDANEQLLRFLQSPENILQATVSQLPVEVGLVAVEDAVKVLDGGVISPKVNYLEGTLLTRTAPAGLKLFEDRLKSWIALCNEK